MITTVLIKFITVSHKIWLQNLKKHVFHILISLASEMNYLWFTLLMSIIWKTINEVISYTKLSNVFLFSKVYKLAELVSTFLFTTVTSERSLSVLNNIKIYPFFSLCLLLNSKWNGWGLPSFTIWNLSSYVSCESGVFVNNYNWLFLICYSNYTAKNISMNL